MDISMGCIKRGETEKKNEIINEHKDSALIMFKEFYKITSVLASNRIDKVVVAFETVRTAYFSYVDRAFAFQSFDSINYQSNAIRNIQSQSSKFFSCTYSSISRVQMRIDI